MHRRLTRGEFYTIDNNYLDKAVEVFEKYLKYKIERTNYGHFIRTVQRFKSYYPYIAYTDDDINSQIATLLSGNRIRESKKGPVEMGDTAVIDYEGFKDDVPFDGGKAERYAWYRIRSIYSGI